jgi:hypothetical protein
MAFKVSESISESIWELKKEGKKCGKYKIFLMTVYIIFKYGKRFRYAPSFNNVRFRHEINLLVRNV